MRTKVSPVNDISFPFHSNSKAHAVAPPSTATQVDCISVVDPSSTVPVIQITPEHPLSSEDLTCEINRGDIRNDLFILNHFLTAPLARESLAAKVNFNPFLVDRALQCKEESGRQPNFVTVDFYATGDLFEATRTLNGL